jgi:hypothetical protein
MTDTTTLMLMGWLALSPVVALIVGALFGWAAGRRKGDDDE